MTESATPTAGTPRAVIVESSDALPGLFPFQAWDALGTAEVVYVRDVDTHPATPHLHFAGLDLDTLPEATITREELNLARPGSPADRRRAKALLQVAVERGSAVYLLGPDDDYFGRTVGLQANDFGVEVEFVFFAQQPQGAEVLRLVEVERQLRDPDGGCPWDLEQDHRSLARYLIEEAYELIEAIEDGTDRDVEEELGDVLLQVVFHAQIAADRRAFTIDDVARHIADKLVRRHPHVFGDADAETAADVQANWDVLKQQEKRRTGPFEGVPMAMPALELAEKLQRRAAKLGFDWPDASGPADRVRQELDELAEATTGDERTEEVGDLLFAVVALARSSGIEAEAALRSAARKFRRRFEAVLEQVEREGRAPADLDLDEWVGIWGRIKADESG